MPIKTPYIIISWVISSYMGPMSIETPFITLISWVISSYMGPMSIEAPYIIIS